jgi:hypothetical protein
MRSIAPRATGRGAWDGWISKFDIYNLKVVAKVRAGINTRNAAVAFNNKYVAVGKPSGKYNVYNKTHYEAGTSH